MIRYIWGLTILGLLLGTPLAAQEVPPQEGDPGAADAAPEAPAPLSAANIATRADEVAASLLSIQKDLESGAPSIATIPDDIGTLGDNLDQLLPALGPAAIDNLSQSDAETLNQTLRRMDGQLDEWRNKLQKFADLVDKDDRAIKLEVDYFRSVLDDERSNELPDALVKRVKEVIRNLEDSRENVREQLDRTLAELSRVSQLKLRISEANESIKARQQRRERNVLSFDRAPLWNMHSSDEPLPPLVLRDVRSRLTGLSEFARANQVTIVISLLLLVIMLAFAAYLRPVIRRMSEARDIDVAQRPFMKRPISLTVLLWAFLVPEIFLPDLPLALGTIRLVIAVGALWRLLPIIVPTARQRSLAGILTLTVVSGVLEIVQQSDLSDRLVLVFVSVAGIYFFRSFARAVTSTAEPERNLWRSLGYGVAKLAPVVMAICIIAVVIGAVAFAQQTVDGMLFLFTLIFAIVVVEGALNAGAQSFISSMGQAWLRSIRRFPDLTRRRFALIIRIAMLAIFISSVPRIFPLLTFFYGWIYEILTVEIEIGTVAMSISDVLALIFGIVLAVYVARFIRFTLDEDVFPRLPIASGAASAASRLIYYVLVAGGILFALAAAGVQLTKLTLVISALGVGIGFGLQGIVNNFVSGLVLAFERPFQIGDIIAVGTLTGRVREIGLRASRVRTFDGAEVIVPNADLIAGNVINWTLSDRMRRLDIKIGVAYGTDPGRVREILLKVAGDSEIVAKNPEPGALFDGFGDSSLNFTLRAWIPEAGDWPQISSDLYEAVHKAITDADIEIPFPQRTLHIKSDDRAQ